MVSRKFLRVGKHALPFNRDAADLRHSPLSSTLRSPLESLWLNDL